MKATSHFAMAHLLYAALQKRGIFLNRIAFVYGNIAPDQTPAMWVAPHFSKVCSRKSSDILTELSSLHVSASGKVGAEYSKQLGYMCHFICDYFCFAHNDDFSGNLKEHMAYENELDSYLRRECLKVLDIDSENQIGRVGTVGELLEIKEQQKLEYMEIGHSLYNDLSFAFNVCVASIVNVTLLSKRVPAPAVVVQLEELVAELKGYSTGNNLIFKMFFFKYRNSNLFFLPELMPPIGAY